MLSNFKVRERNFFLDICKHWNSSKTIELLPPVRRDAHGRNLHNADKLTKPFAKTLCFQNSSIPFSSV